MPAQALARGDARLSKPDCWAAVCAKRDNHRLLCGDATLRSRAEVDAIQCSGGIPLGRLLHVRCELPVEDQGMELRCIKSITGFGTSNVYQLL